MFVLITIKSILLIASPFSGIFSARHSRRGIELVYGRHRFTGLAIMPANRHAIDKLVSEERAGEFSYFANLFLPRGCLNPSGAIQRLHRGFDRPWRRLPFF